MQRVFTFKFYKKNSNLKEKDLLFTQEKTVSNSI